MCLPWYILCHHAVVGLDTHTTSKTTDQIRNAKVWRKLRQISLHILQYTVPSGSLLSDQSNVRAVVVEAVRFK